MAKVPFALLPRLITLPGRLGGPDTAGWLRMAMLPTLHSDMAARIRLSQSAADVRGVMSICLQQGTNGTTGQKVGFAFINIWVEVYAERVSKPVFPPSTDESHHVFLYKVLTHSALPACCPGS